MTKKLNDGQTNNGHQYTGQNKIWITAGRTGKGELNTNRTSRDCKTTRKSIVYKETKLRSELENIFEEKRQWKRNNYL